MIVRVSCTGRLNLAKASLLLCLVLPAPHSIEAIEQSAAYTFKNWETEDGLPQATPRVITQTRDGYLWIGTFNGLARFDGVQFRSFTVNNTPQLKSDHINVLYEDRATNLWIGTSEGGLVRYREGEFMAIPSSSLLSVNAICEDDSGKLLIATSAGIYGVSDDGLAAHVIEGFAANVEVIALMPGQSEELWIGTRRSLHRTRGGKVIDGPLTFSEEVHAMELDEPGRPWVAFSNAGLGFVELAAVEHHSKVSVGEIGQTGEGLGENKFSRVRHRFKANAMHRNKEGKLWLGTHGGPLLQLLPGKTNTFWTAARFAKHPITAVFEDRDGHLWLGIESRGLFQLRRKVLQNLGTEQGLLTEVISSICQDRQGKIWVGTFGKGLHLWDPIQERFESMRRDAVNVTTLLSRTNGDLLFGRFGGSLGIRDSNGRFEYPDGFGIRARVLFEDRHGGLWIGTMENGLEHMKDGVLTRFTTREGLASDHVRSLAQDASGSIWIGTSRGLNRLQGNRIEFFDRSHGLGGNEIRALFVDSEGTLWVGSTGGGLTRWSEGAFRSIGKDEGLINDWIEQIVEDEDGNLWLGSNGGLMRVSLKQLNDCASGIISLIHPSFFGRSDGLLLPHCGTGFQPSSLRASDGKLWFGTEAGIILIEPKQIKSNTNAPAVYIEELQADDRIIRVQANRPDTKDLPAGTQRLEFRFTALDFMEPAKLRFRYKLEGLDSDWINAGMHREAIYNRLPPAEYTFRVMAANNHGVWSEVDASLAISIAPFFWQTRTFQASSIGGVLAATGLITWLLLVRKHRRELEALAQRHALEQERARIARDIHDGVGASLVRISLLGDLALRQFTARKHAEDPVRKMTTTARKVLRDMDEIVWAVDPKNDTLENFATYLCHFTNEHFQDTQIACRLDIPTQFPPVTLSANTRHNLLLATQEALNNVLKHSSASFARVSLELQGSLLVVEIEDNGSSPMEKPSRQGNGIKNIQERLFQIGGTVTFAQLAGGGTQVRMAVRIKESI